MSADQAPISVDLAGEPDFTLGALQVRPSLREVVDGSEREVLEPRVMQVLVVLARRRGQVVSRDQLSEACWAGRVVGEDAINRCIARVRRLAEAHGGFSIETIARVGYRLTEQDAPEAPPTEVTSASSDAAAVELQPAAASSPAAAVENRLALAVSRRSGLIAVLAIVAALLAGAAYIGITQQRSREQAQQHQARVLVQVAELVREDRYAAAFVLARPLSRIESMRTNPDFAKLWQQIVVRMKPLVAQSGATVYFKPYDDARGEWILAGTTPIKEWIEAPRGALRLKVIKDGFRTAHFVVAVPGPSVEVDLPKRFPFDPPSVPLALAAEGELPDDMVLVPRTNMPVYLAGWSTGLLGGDLHDIPSFAIARNEVTNREFKEFVDAGGYDAPEYWQELSFTHDGRTLSWSEARKRFVDTTGRPGPAGWQLSTYPEGQDELPVGGISWYEAVAYARFRKQLLPTIHHWMRAAFTPYDPMFPTAAAITAQSRFSADGPVSARSEQGLGPWGTFHMAGNVREWIWNSAGSEAVALGSGWTEYAMMFAVIYTADPMARFPDHGLRLMRTLGPSPVESTLLEPIKLVRDTAFANRAPLSNEAFEAMRFQFTSPRAAPAEVTATKVQESTLWIAEEVVLKFAAQESTTLYVVRPKSHDAPLQPIVYSGVGDCCFMKRPNRDVLEQLQIAGFIVNGGRALVMPIWAGGYERYSPYPTEADAVADRERRLSLQWQHDLSTSIDYLESRPDMDVQRLGYFGISRGASFAGAINLAIEPRVRAAVLASGGIWIHAPLHPMIDLINYAPRIRMPVLMLSSRYDHIYPYEQSQKRTFALLGTPPDKKAQISYDTGHFTMPRNRVAADVTDWFDRHLGPAQK